MCVCAVPENLLTVDWRLLVKKRIAYMGIPLGVPGFCCFLFLYLKTSLLCIMGELAGGGSAAVAVGVSDT